MNAGSGEVNNVTNTNQRQQARANTNDWEHA